MAGGITALQKIAEAAQSGFALFVVLYKDPAVTGYDPRNDRAAASLADMVSGAGLASVEVARVALTFAAGGSGVTLDTSAIAAHLIADPPTISSLALPGDGSGVGGYALCGEDSGAVDDGDRWLVGVMPLQTVRYPDGGDFDIVWPTTGVLIVR